MLNGNYDDLIFQNNQSENSKKMDGCYVYFFNYNYSGKSTIAIADLFL